jgi:hypothetical protein
MNTHWIVILGILICSSLNGQTSKRLLILKDSMNNALIGATIMYFDDNNNKIITTRSDLDGRVTLRKDFKRLSVWLVGFQKVFYSSNDLIKDTNIVFVPSVRYDCPDLIIKKDKGFTIDTIHYINEIVDNEIYYDESPLDTIRENDSTVIVEIRDTLKMQMECKLSVPKFGGYFHYYGRLVDNITLLQQIGCFDSRLIVVNFSVDKFGKMFFDSINGVKIEYVDTFKNKIKDSWIPAKMWDRPMKTDYRMKIKIE